MTRVKGSSTIGRTPAKRRSHIHRSSVQHQYKWGYCWHLFWIFFFFFKTVKGCEYGTRSAEEDQEDVLSAAEGNEYQERRMGVDLLKWWKAAGCGGLHPPLCVNKPVIPIRVTHATTDKFPEGCFLKCWFLREVWVYMSLDYVGGGVLFQSECRTDSYNVSLACV